ncbi:MAG: MFS transporter [Micromonosporaceae bacterium]
MAARIVTRAAGRRGQADPATTSPGGTRAAGTVLRAARLAGTGTARGGRWLARRVRAIRDRGAAGEVGMMRLLDLHAASCAGDTLVAIGLAGTIFFSAPLGEARGKVALYLLVTMVPFALLAPVVGPLLDNFRHGRRYALAATMLGRAFLAWLISDYIHGFGLYPAAFGVLVLSRSYGVARSAAVPRLLPARLGLSEAGARASVYGTLAGAAVAPLGAAAFTFGPQWPLRVASVIFLVGMVVALRLPPRADSDRPQTMPRILRLLRRPTNGEKALSGRLVLAAVAGSAGLRALYGFLLLFLAFAIKAGDLDPQFLTLRLRPEVAVGLVGAALGTGTFLATAVGTALRIRRPLAVQAAVLLVTAALTVLAALRFTLPMVAVMCLVAAIASGLAKLSVDASIQERVPEHIRASAFANAETLLMLAWVAGGAIGLIPFNGRVGVGVAAAVMVLAAARAVLVAARLRKERLNGKEGLSGKDTAPAGPAEPTPGRRRRPTSTRPSPYPAPSSPAPSAPAPSAQAPTLPAPPPEDGTPAPPGYHIYRPSAARPVDQTER